ncbi:MAG: hypothetical protein ACOZNI_25150 [Myxococcota bacterium]
MSPLWVALAAATGLSVRTLPCPLGGGTVKVHEKLSENAAGGYDSDLARYSSGGQWRAVHVSTCDGNLFSLYAEDMASPLSPERQRALVPVLEAAVARVADRGSPTPWERYAIAAALYEALGRDDVFLGDLWLEASWTARDLAVGYYPGLNGPVEARKLLDAGWQELKKPLADADRRKVLHNLARVAHRGGWTEERDGYLGALEALGGLDAEARATVERFRRATREIEPRLQDEAIARYRAALTKADALPHDEKVRVSYLLADLLRRRGRAREALPLFFLVANDAKAEETLRGLALFLAGDLAAAAKH